MFRYAIMRFQMWHYYTSAHSRTRTQHSHLHARRARYVFAPVPYRGVRGVDVDTAGGFEGLRGLRVSPVLREAGKRPLLPQLNLFNLPNPLHADSTRRREYSPLSALDDSNSCVSGGNQPPEHDHEFPGGKFRCAPRFSEWYF